MMLKRLVVLTPLCMAFAGMPTSAIAQIEQNMSLTGTRLTYYPRPDGNQCITDCTNNPACQGVTWIQAGTYNPNDAAMCYLMSAVSGRSPARNHYSMVKRAAPAGPQMPPQGAVRPGGPQNPPAGQVRPGGFTPADIGTI